MATQEVVLLYCSGRELQKMQKEIFQMERDGWQVVVPPCDQEHWRPLHGKFWIAVLNKPLPQS